MGKGSPEKAQTERKKKADGVNYRFTKDEKIRNKKDFIRVYAEGKRYVCPEFVGFYLKRDDRSSDEAPVKPSRLGMSVGKKVGGAVIRNTVKRRIREIFRIHKSLLKPGFDIVMIPRGKECKFADLEKAILMFFSSSGLMSGH